MARQAEGQRVNSSVALRLTAAHSASSEKREW
jgi:hypothetical protein